MQEHSLLARIETQFSSKLPFVVYRKPGKDAVNTIFLKNDELTFVKNYTEQGFVFAPFDTTKKAILFPAKQSDTSIFESNSTIKRTTSLEATDANSQRENHIALVKKGIEVIANGEMKKVVLSRKQKHTTSLSPSQITERLLTQYSNAFVYCWYHPKVGLWAGATPETLLSVVGNRFQTMALAGTKSYEGNLDVSWGEKEKEEQQLVTDSILSHLQDKMMTIQANEIQTHKAGNLLHLKTDISGTFREDSTLIEIIEALHPTSAVCGLPKERARSFILEQESYDREFYTGFLGEINMAVEHKRSGSRRNVENLAYRAVRKHTELFVNLRCMQLDTGTAKVYIGGGITARSNPESEWEETVKKMETMCNIL